MIVWNGLGQAQVPRAGTVVTIGNFDGVHRGHAEVLRRVVSLARLDGRMAAALTFNPHPAQVHRPETAPPLITGFDSKLALLEATGLDAVLVEPYTLDFAAQTAEEFVVKYLVGGLRARSVVVGHDVRFGARNSGHLATMVSLGEQHGFEVVAISDVGHMARTADGADYARWSSSAVRDWLTVGDVGEAANILGRPHQVTGVVVHGDHRGRQLGFPTANLGRVEGMIPADGVYAGWLILNDGDDAGRRQPAAISIGTNPTFDGARDRRVEAFVIDRDDAAWDDFDIYDRPVTVEFTHMLRPTV
ncbi:MAG: bifunctional riboflavin kinase/FAD synthetase, partial [Cellulomonadaceae bacterium]|nr:bifunctional riboflavin kinase/FAD synthetase [Cellulomonadaceae bacterium]